MLSVGMHPYMYNYAIPDITFPHFNNNSIKNRHLQATHMLLSTV